LINSVYQPHTASVVIQPFYAVAENIFIWSLAGKEILCLE